MTDCQSRLGRAADAANQVCYRRSRRQTIDGRQNFRESFGRLPQAARIARIAQPTTATPPEASTRQAAGPTAVFSRLEKTLEDSAEALGDRPFGLLRLRIDGPFPPDVDVVAQITTADLL